MSGRYLVVIICSITLLITASGSLFAQGFGGLGTDAEGFETPKQGVELSFPADHGPHPKYRIEWWYLTANLQGEDGREYGVQWTLFRSALKPKKGEGWSSPQLWMGHAAVTSANAHYVSEVRSRGGIRQAGVEIQPFKAWINDWSMLAAGSDSGDLQAVKVKASGKEFSYDLELTTSSPLVPQGDRGYSVKSESGSASYYYSQPFYKVAGILSLPSGEVRVTGTAWLDREWSSQPLAANQEGWDWISLHLDSGAKVMGFQLRQADGMPYTSATWINSNGTPEPLPNGAIKMIAGETTQVAGRNIPVTWKIELPAKGLDVTIDALNPNSWMVTSFPYWEGPVKISGTHGGRGYLEMTGY